MTRTSVVLSVVWALIGQQHAVASPTVAVVSVPKVSERYHRTGDLEAGFEKKREQLNQEREAIRDKIQLTARSLEEELKPGTDAYRSRQKQLAILKAEHQFFVEVETKQIERQLAESLRMIFADIQAVVRVVAEERGIDLVLAADMMPQGAPETPLQVRQQIILQKVLFWAPRVDLTDEVIVRLNAQYEARKSNK